MEPHEYHEYHEPEITAEMISAGVAAYDDATVLKGLDDETIVKIVFVAMFEKIRSA